MPAPRPSKTHIGNHALKPETLMLSYGYDPALSEGAVKPPVFLTSTFVFGTAEQGRDFFDYVAGRRQPPPPIPARHHSRSTAAGRTSRPLRSASRSSGPPAQPEVGRPAWIPHSPAVPARPRVRVASAPPAVQTRAAPGRRESRSARTRTLPRPPRSPADHPRAAAPTLPVPCGQSL